MGKPLRCHYYHSSSWQAHSKPYAGSDDNSDYQNDNGALGLLFRQAFSFFSPQQKPAQRQVPFIHTEDGIVQDIKVIFFSFPFFMVFHLDFLTTHLKKPASFLWGCTESPQVNQKKKKEKETSISKHFNFLLPLRGEHFLVNPAVLWLHLPPARRNNTPH